MSAIELHDVVAGLLFDNFRPWLLSFPQDGGLTSRSEGNAVDSRNPGLPQNRRPCGSRAPASPLSCVLMKPAPFDYVRPASVAEACALLRADADARLIAGGQTLVPMLAMRLARPARLIDILRLPELAGIREEARAVTVGATTRQAQAERDPVIRASVPLLAQVLPWVGHPPTRNRGTIGGSIANADPSAEIPLAAVTLGAELLLATPHGERSVPAHEFFIGAMLTALGHGDCVRAVR